MVEDLTQMLGDKRMMQEYQEWLKNPVTIFMKRLAEQAARPTPLAQIEPNRALYMLGYLTGASETLNLVFALDKVVPESLAHQASNLEADYNAEQVIKEMNR